jgi:hypothetical protein
MRPARAPSSNPTAARSEIPSLRFQWVNERTNHVHNDIEEIGARYSGRRYGVDAGRRFGAG